LVDLSAKKLIKSYIREVNCYKELQGVNILKFVGHCVKQIDDGLELMVITEFMSKGSLAKVIDSEIELSYRRRLEIATGIISGLARLHELNFVHRDLRLDNILIGEDYLPKIGDMGLAIHENCTQHMAPEFFSGEAITAKLDIFSFGLILVELFKGEYYINELTRRINLIQKPVVFLNLIYECLEKDPAKRPSARWIENYLDLLRGLIDDFIFKILENYVFMDKVEKDETFVEIHDLIVANLKGKLRFTEHFSTARKDEKKYFKSNIGCPIS
jgi:serine/threonine protein kinase